MSFRLLNVITRIILIAGGINWGLYGAFDFDLIALLFGRGSDAIAQPTLTSQIAYIVVGLAAAWQGVVLIRSVLVPGRDEPTARLDRSVGGAG